MPFKHKSKAKQEIKGVKKYECLKTFPVYTKWDKGRGETITVNASKHFMKAPQTTSTLEFLQWLGAASATRCDKSGTFPWKRFVYIYVPTIHRERRPRRKCKHISVIIEAGTHKAKYRVVMQSITWLWVEFRRELSYFTFAPTDHKLTTARNFFF